MKEFICICCPLGCHLNVDDTDKQNIKVWGNSCIRGKNYAIDEVVAPKRMVTSIVSVKDGTIDMVSVKTNRSIPKEKIFDALSLLKGVQVDAPVHVGQKIVSDVFGADFIATKEVSKKP